MAALRADPKRGLELVVAVMRVTDRAGVRVLRRRGRLVVGLDGDVDLGHVASLDLPYRRRVAPAVHCHSPSAAVRRSTFSTLAGSGARPVRPTPTTVPRSRIRPRTRSSSARVGPPGSGMNEATSLASKTSQSIAT